MQSLPKPIIKIINSMSNDALAGTCWAYTKLAYNFRTQILFYLVKRIIEIKEYNIFSEKEWPIFLEYYRRENYNFHVKSFDKVLINNYEYNIHRYFSAASSRVINIKFGGEITRNIEASKYYVCMNCGRGTCGQYLIDGMDSNSERMFCYVCANTGRCKKEGQAPLNMFTRRIK